MSSAKFQPFCLGLNALRSCGLVVMETLWITNFELMDTTLECFFIICIYKKTISCWFRRCNWFSKWRQSFDDKLCNIRNVRNRLHWRHNDQDCVSNRQPHGCLLNRLFRRRSKKTSKLRVTGLRVGNSPGPVNSPHKGPVTRKMFPFDDVIMICNNHKEFGWLAYRINFASV